MNTALSLILKTVSLTSILKLKFTIKEMVFFLFLLVNYPFDGELHRGLCIGNEDICSTTSCLHNAGYFVLI